MKLLRGFGKHYAIERFAILFVVLFTSMCVLITTIVTTKLRYDKSVRVNQTIYTTNFVFSRSGTTGTVEAVYSNHDQNKIFLLLHLDDISSMSLNADDYQMYVCGADMNQLYETLETPDVTGGIYLFGISGYMGLYFENPEPFPGQLYDVIIRSYADLVGTTGDVTGQSTQDASFNDYDQARVYFNPGGLNMQYADFLEEGSHDAMAIYQQTVLLQMEQDIRDTAYSDLRDMFELITLMSQYSSRLEDEFDITYDAEPEMIADDSIDVRTVNGQKVGWSSVEHKWMDEEGNEYPDSDVILSLITSHHIDGGYSYNWQNLHIKDTGYLSSVLGANEDARELFKKNSAILADKKSAELNMDNVHFYYTNGQQIDLTEMDSKLDQQSVQVKTEIKRLQDVWSQFYALKYKYETQDLYDLLYLEYNANNVTEKYSYSFLDDTLIVH